MLNKFSYLFVIFLLYGCSSGGNVVLMNGCYVSYENFGIYLDRNNLRYRANNIGGNYVINVNRDGDTNIIFYPGIKLYQGVLTYSSNGPSSYPIISRDGVATILFQNEKSQIRSFKYIGERNSACNSQSSELREFQWHNWTAPVE